MEKQKTALFPGLPYDGQFKQPGTVSLAAAIERAGEFLAPGRWEWDTYTKVANYLYDPVMAEELELAGPVTKYRKRLVMWVYEWLRGHFSTGTIRTYIADLSGEIVEIVRPSTWTRDDFRNPFEKNGGKFEDHRSLASSLFVSEDDLAAALRQTLCQEVARDEEPAVPEGSEVATDDSATERQLHGSSSGRGRPKGTGYQSKDEDALQRMLELVNSNQAGNATAAARIVVAEIGRVGASDAAMVDRLVRKYGKRYPRKSKTDRE